MKNSTKIARFLVTRFALVAIFITLSTSANAQCVAAPVPNDACYNIVITNDPFCCNTMWDGICQAAYDACIPPPPPCVFAPVPNDACYNTVITNDPFCCNTLWDAFCQATYDACLPPPPPCVAAPVPNDACYNTVITNDPFCCNTMWDALCQASYDACVPAVGPCANITAMIGCGASMGVNLSGTGAGWSPSACGFATPGTESIVSFTATSTGIHTLDVSAIGGGFIDFQWINAANGCGPGVAWNCISDVSTTGNYGAMNWVAGQTYYILLDPEGIGAFSTTFNIDCPNGGGPVTAGDCFTAQPVCTNLNFQVDPNGFGLIDELCTSCVANPSANPSSLNFGCLNSGELNSTWFEVNVAVGGTLEYSFGTPGSGNCYDWIMWPLNATTCADIQGNTLPPTSCNWNSPCDGFTGIANTLPVGGQAGNFEPGINVNAGDQFIICFSNFSSALTTVPLDFFGSADISCTPLPVEMFGFAGEAQVGYNELVWHTAAEFHNSHFEVERSSNGEEFTKVGEVQGAGNSSSELSYRFNHYGYGEQINYYRIKQVDYDGAYEYSKVIAIGNVAEDGFKVISAYPNPATDLFSIQLYVVDADMFDITIKEASGKTARAFNNQSILEGTNVLDLPVDGLANGIYYVTITDNKNQQLETIKLVIN